MKKLLSVLALLVSFGECLAQGNYPPGQVYGNSSATTRVPRNETMGAMLLRATSGTVGGTASAITLTTGQGLTALTDGQEFIFTPTATVAGSIPTLAVDSTGAKQIKGVDGYTFSVYYDIQKDKPLRVRYNASLNVYVIVSPPLGFEGAVQTHGRMKFSGADASPTKSVALYQDDGQGMMMWNSATLAYRLQRMPSITNSDISTTTNMVNGVCNQALASNQLYSVYVSNKNPTTCADDPTNALSNTLEFWSTYLGVGVPGWNPTTNELGLYVKPTVAGGSTADNSRTYVGMLWTGPSHDVGVVLTGSALAFPTQSHFHPWLFPVQSDTVTVSGFTTGTPTLQTTPSLLVVSEGVEMLPLIKILASYKNTMSGTTATLAIQQTQICYNGATQVLTSRTMRQVATEANKWYHFEVDYGNASCMGVYTAQPLISVDGGSATFELTLTGYAAE